MNKRFSWSGLSALVLFVATVTFIGRSVSAGPGTTPNAKDRRIAARTASALGGARDERSELVRDPSMVGGNGEVEPAQPETKVASQVGGRIADVFVKEGDHAEQDAPLVALDGSVEEAALAAAEADLATAQATFARVAHGNRTEDIEAALADAAAAKAKADNSSEVFERTVKLVHGGASTADDLDRAHNTATSDTAAYKALDARAHAMTAGSRYEEVSEGRAKVSAARARRDEARATLDRLTVRAPITGTILRVKFRAGEYYNPSGAEPLLIVGDTSKLRVRMDVDERDVSRVRVGAHGFVLADSWQGRRFPATVVEIGKRMGRQNIRTDDPVERIDTKILEAVLELNEATPLVPGLRVTAYVESQP